MGTKLIEVALPLDAINAASAREKSIRHGHPSTLHLWWARRPLAAARAVLFASIVDDPSSPDYRWPDGATRPRSDAEIEVERERLHDLISEMVRWENSNNEDVLRKVRAEIQRATDGNPPPVLDPFAGGGTIPLEAQRLGLEAYASDLNPVAVLINKALIEIPPTFAGQPPVNPDYQRSTAKGGSWPGATGLAADVRYYGKWMRDEAERRIGHLYPKVKLPPEQGGGEATVIAWLWARTVTCPNPACGAQMPLVSSFWLSKKRGKGTWVVPHPDPVEKRVRFSVATSDGMAEAPEPPKLGRGARFRCLVCGEVATDQHLKSEGSAGRMGAQLMAIVAEGRGRRLFLPPSAEHEAIARQAEPAWKPDQALAGDRRALWTPPYGLRTFGDLFTDRQLVALTTFCDLVGEARQRAEADAVAAGLPDDGVGIADGGAGATAYADAIATYLAFAVDRLANGSSTISTWNVSLSSIRNTFSRQAIPMTWDFAEGNPFSGSTGSFQNQLLGVVDALENSPASGKVNVSHQDAVTLQMPARRMMVSTDPPYYDNVGYADLSDFFYVWLRRALGHVYPEVFATMLVPKRGELVATPYRFEGGTKEAEKFFESGLYAAFDRLRSVQDFRFPTTIYYAFKQAETQADSNGTSHTASTGWETMLEGLIRSGFSITGTWPMRTERSGRPVGLGTNALASSIVLVCRPRAEQASSTTRSDFLRQLRRELPTKLKIMQQASIAPVDLAQAAIGPGMAIFSRFAGVLEADGTKMRVRTALQLINQVLDEVLAEQDSEYDSHTGWAVAWFEQFGTNEGPYGQAETLAKARNVSMPALVEAGIVSAGRGKVRLLRRAELPTDWDPANDHRLTDWEITQHLIRALEEHGQEGAARLKRKTGDRAERAKDLAYRLYTVAERKGWAQEALSYNGLVVAWPDITKLASELTPAEVQAPLGM